MLGCCVTGCLRVSHSPRSSHGVMLIARFTRFARPHTSCPLRPVYRFHHLPNPIPIPPDTDRARLLVPVEFKGSFVTPSPLNHARPFWVLDDVRELDNRAASTIAGSAHSPRFQNFEHCLSHAFWTRTFVCRLRPRYQRVQRSPCVLHQSGGVCSWDRSHSTNTAFTQLAEEVESVRLLVE